MHAQKGFSLIELLIVVTIILIIAAIAIPNMLSARIAANEASAVGSLRDITTAEVAYSTAYPDEGYAIALGTLGPGPAGNTTVSKTYAFLLDNVLGCSTAMGSSNTCTKSGYVIDIAVPSAAHPVGIYSVYAVPETVGISGRRYFFTDQSGVIRYNATTGANSNDAALQ